MTEREARGGEGETLLPGERWGRQRWQAEGRSDSALTVHSCETELPGRCAGGRASQLALTFRRYAQLA